MSADRVNNWLRGLAATTLFVVALPASAVIYSSAFDPATFSGTGIFQFDDACLAADGFYTASFCHLQMVSAHVDITNDGNGGTGQLNFGPDTNDMQSLVIQNGTLVGINTSLIGWVFANPCTVLPACASVPWWINWHTNLGPPASFGARPPSFDNEVFLWMGNCDGEECFPNQEPSGVATNVTFTRLTTPEPASLALLLGALAVGWLARRRR
jgi:hypothetical protein